jgi:hypothetical protein
MTGETSQLLDALKRNSAQWAMEMMNLSIALGELGRVASDPAVIESCMVKAKRAYGSALTKGTRAFTVEECSDFEHMSVRAEMLITELQARLTNREVAPTASGSSASSPYL